MRTIRCSLTNALDAVTNLCIMRRQRLESMIFGVWGGVG